MSNTKHTPGPWTAVRVAATLTIKSDTQPGYFAEIRGACAAAHGKEAEANARLIAAAPELLAEAMLLRCLASSPRFQGMTVRDALSELANNGMTHDNGAAVIKAGGR